MLWTSLEWRSLPAPTLVLTVHEPGPLGPNTSYFKWGFRPSQWVSWPLASAEPTADLCLWFLLGTGSNYVLRYKTSDEKYDVDLKRSDGGFSLGPWGTVFLWSNGRVFTRSMENNVPLWKFGGADVMEITSPQVPAYANPNNPFTRDPPTGWLISFAIIKLKLVFWW